MPKPAANLKRFKGTMQGIREFACLLEQSDPQAREMILAAAEKDDARFTEQALRKVVYFEELVYIEETILAELLSKVTPKVLAFALQDMPASFSEVLTKQLGFREKKLLQEENATLGAKKSESFVLGARKQILKMARSLEAQNKFVFELSDCPRFNAKKKTG
jgi:flagellar motor switch protein FliG